MKVPWTEHKTHEEILQMVESEREIIDTVRSRQKRWLGHILRHDSLQRITLEGQMRGKKVHGRPRTIFLDWLLKREEGNISYEELKMFAEDNEDGNLQNSAKRVIRTLAVYTCISSCSWLSYFVTVILPVWQPGFEDCFLYLNILKTCMNCIIIRNHFNIDVTS